jgi:hypothetical protein
MERYTGQDCKGGIAGQNHKESTTKRECFFGMADIFREGKEDLSSACWLSNRKEADGTADCIKTGL